MQLLSRVETAHYYASPVSPTFGNTSDDFSAWAVVGRASPSDNGNAGILSCYDSVANQGWRFGYALSATGLATITATVGDGAGTLVVTGAMDSFFGRLLVITLRKSSTRVWLHCNGQIIGTAAFVTGYTGTSTSTLRTGAIGSGLSSPGDLRFFGAAFQASGVSTSQVAGAFEAISQSEEMVLGANFAGVFAEFDYAWDVPTGLQPSGTDLAPTTWTARNGGVDLSFAGGGDPQELIVYPKPMWA